MTLRTELQTTLDRMARAYVAGDAPACAALFTADAALHSPYAAPARGRAEIEVLHRDWTRGATAKHFQVLDCDGSGDLAWALARFSEEAATDAGTSLAVFVRGPDGSWLIRMCSLNERVT